MAALGELPSAQNSSFFDPDPALLERLINNGADINMLLPTNPPTTPLVHIISCCNDFYNRDFLVAVLLRHGVDINLPITNPPIRAVITHPQGQEIPVIAELLLARPALDVNYTALAADPNAAEADRSATALTDAIENGAHSVALMLVQRRPDLDVNKGYPLVSAVKRGSNVITMPTLGDLHTDLILSITEHLPASSISNLSRACNGAWTFLNSRLYHRFAKEVYLFIANTGSEATLQRALAYSTPFTNAELLFALISKVNEQHRQHGIRIAELLLSAQVSGNNIGIDLNWTNWYGHTLLEKAVIENIPSLVKVLLDAGVYTGPFGFLLEDVQPFGYDGSLLRYAAFKGYIDILRLLTNSKRAGDIDQGASTPSLTPLAKAIEGGSLDCAELLLKSGADPNIILPNNESPLNIASRTTSLVGRHNIRTAMMQLFLAHNADAASPANNPPLRSAIRAGHPEAVDVVLANPKTDVNHTTMPSEPASSLTDAIKAKKGYLALSLLSRATELELDVTKGHALALSIRHQNKP
ncbi:ankyrin repeat-containing domain protein [Aspergillus multicolor]|uniref:ankyrin repeat-containing domain protein n=1 Tax=Aspergillus multicolor TaxID=41759 RepID=UPI003CCD2036